MGAMQRLNSDWLLVGATVKPKKLEMISLAVNKCRCGHCGKPAALLVL